MFLRKDKMQIIFFSGDLDGITQLKQVHSIKNSLVCDGIQSLEEKMKEVSELLVIVDFDSIANEFNKFLTTDSVPKNTIVLESSPEIATGKMLITHGVKAYGNTRMLNMHFSQMLETVRNNKVWTYPELTVSLIKDTNLSVLNQDSVTLIQNRLSPKEIEVIYYILDALTNDTIAQKLNITTRTVKAHVSSIFSKLHVSDRVSLVLLLK